LSLAKTLVVRKNFVGITPQSFQADIRGEALSLPKSPFSKKTLNLRI
jgi:hypothetical protein